MVTNIGDMLILFDDEHGHHSLADQCFLTLDNNDSSKSRRAYRTIPSFQFGSHDDDDDDDDDDASLTQSLSYHPVIPLDVLMNSSQLQRTISFYSESLLMDAMFIQSTMGDSIKETDNPLPLTCQILQQLLDHGLTYVITQPSAKLLILFPLQRSMILLRNRIDTRIISSSHQTVVTIPAAATAEHSSPFL
jgi:hypothetical protein